MTLSAFVLAGGRSSRMGRDKAALTLGGQTLLERAQELARSVTDRVRVCGPRERFGPEAIEDRFHRQGPLAGIHACLSATDTEYNLVLAVDLPFITPEFVRFLAGEAGRSAAIVSVPTIGGRVQPLCGVYRREFVAVAERALKAEQNRIDALFAWLPVRMIDEAEIRRLAFDPRMFDNLNTPEDFERAQQRA